MTKEELAELKAATERNKHKTVAERLRSKIQTPKGEVRVNDAFANFKPLPKKAQVK